MKKFMSVVVLLLALVAMVGCGKGKSKDIRVASVGPLSGPAAVYGQSVKKGIELGVEEVNKAGGVKVGEDTVKVDFFDFKNDEATPDKAKAAFGALDKAGLDFLLGAVTSGATNGLVTEAAKTGVPVLTPTGTAEMLTVGDGSERDKRSNVFRACFIDSFQGQMMAKFAKDKGYKKVAVVYNNESDYSKGLFDAFKKEAEANGITVTGEGYQKTTTSFQSYFAKESVKNADAVYVPDYYETVKAIVETGRAEGYTGAFLGADGWDGVESVEGFKAADFENTYFTNHFTSDGDNAKVKAFVKAYKDKYNEEPNVFAALAYDSVYIMKAAYEKAGTKKYEDVVAAMASKDFSVDCVTGKISFDENGNPKKSAFVITFKDGKKKFEKEVK